jgi:hypothetical protein
VLMQRFLLTNIPLEIQKRYGIGKEVEVNADGSVLGGHFTLVNRAGERVGIDAVELFGTDIFIQRIG